jgi:hypothetical protein
MTNSGNSNFRASDYSGFLVNIALVLGKTGTLPVLTAPITGISNYWLPLKHHYSEVIDEQAIRKTVTASQQKPGGPTV